MRPTGSPTDRFPKLSIEEAAGAEAGQIEITLDLVERALDEADRIDARQKGWDPRLVAKPRNPKTGRIPRN